MSSVERKCLCKLFW